jgi:hypothetical protein
MSNTKNTVAIKVNQDKLLANLEFSFSNQSTVLGELMQNARRAGATEVHFTNVVEGELMISDNGKGISDFQNLFSVAESGWDAATVQNERPFGMGWLSALYTSEHVYVESNGQYIEGKSSEILAGSALEVKSCDILNTGSYTTVILTGFKLNTAKTKDALDKLAEGFAIPVSFNGQKLDQKYKLDTEHFLEVAGIGHIYAPEANLKGWRTGDLTANCKVYLQGLPVSRSSSVYHTIENVIHLDSANYFARMPDRDKLIDEQEVLKKVHAAINQIHLDRLIALKGQLTPEEFAGRSIADYALNIEGGFKVLCDKDVRLSEYFYGLVDPIQPSCYGDHSKSVNSSIPSVSYEEVASGETMFFITDAMSEYEDESNAAAWIFAKKMQWNLLEHHYHYKHSANLIHDHWVGSFVHDLNNDNLTVEVVGLGKTGDVGLNYWPSNCHVVLCESYKITYKAKDGKEYVAEINDEPLWTRDGQLLVPSEAKNVGEAVMQGSSYMNEDEFQEHEQEIDGRALRLYVEMLRSGDEVTALQSMLNTINLSEYKDFIGQQYVLTLNEHCGIQLSKLAA